MTKSKNKTVNLLLSFQPMVRRCWCLAPPFLSRYLLSVFRNSNSSVGFVLRYLCVSKLAHSCGEKVVIAPSVFLVNIQNISFGTNIFIGEMSYLDGYGGIDIGNDVAIAHGCTIVSSDHTVDNIATSVKDSDAITGRVTIGHDVWIGASVKVLKGVTMCDHSVIGAGSVVTSDIAKWSISVGVPARHMRYRKQKSE